MNLEIHIERLIVDGLAVEPGHGERLRGAVAAELARLLQPDVLDSALASGGARDRLAGGTVRWTPAGGTEDLGRQIARATYDGLAPARRGRPR